MIAPPAATLRVPAGELRPGDVIHPPARELRLWMRRDATERGLDPACLLLTVLQVRVRYARGPDWCVIEAERAATYPNAGPSRWSLLAKRTTLWPVVTRGGAP